MKIIPAALAAFTIFTLALRPQAGPLSRNAISSMDVPLGAKAEALGGAFTSWADDSSAIFWNPGGLALLNRTQIQTTYNKWMLDTAYGDVTGSFPSTWGTLGARFSYVDFGTFERRDDFGYKTGYLQAHAWGGTVGAAHRFGNYGLGLATKIYRESGDGGFQLTGYALDAGMLGRFDKLSFGAGIRNLGKVSGYSLPTVFYGGISKVTDFRLVTLHLLTDFSILRGDNAFLHHGVELDYRHLLFLRAGYQWKALKALQEAGAGFSAGGGIRVADIQFDYSVTPDETLGWNHKVTLGYQFKTPSVKTEIKAVVEQETANESSDEANKSTNDDESE
jgi:hypothetical protein